MKHYYVIDVRYLRIVYKYSEIKQIIANVAMEKFLNRLYYLNEECIFLVRFNDKINKATKAKILIIDNEENMYRKS